MVCTGDYIYYSGSSGIFKIDRQGNPIETVDVMANVIQDIAIDKSTLYYVSNGAEDLIIKIDSDDELTIVETGISSLYTLAIDSGNLIVVTGSNEIRRFDIETGEKISDAEMNIEGWVTAIVPYKN